MIKKKKTEKRGMVNQLMCEKTKTHKITERASSEGNCPFKLHVLLYDLCHPY